MRVRARAHARAKKNALDLRALNPKLGAGRSIGHGPGRFVARPPASRPYRETRPPGRRFLMALRSEHFAQAQTSYFSAAPALKRFCWTAPEGPRHETAKKHAKHLGAKPQHLHPPPLPPSHHHLPPPRGRAGHRRGPGRFVASGLPRPGLSLESQTSDVLIFLSPDPSGL